GKHALGKLCKEPGRALIENLVLKRIAAGRVFVAPLRTFRMCWILNRYIVNLMPAMQMPQHLERADLPTFRGGVHEIGVDPENLHRARSVSLASKLSCRSLLP